MLTQNCLDPVKAIPQIPVLIKQLPAGLLGFPQSFLQNQVIDFESALAVSGFERAVIQHRKPPSRKLSGHAVLS